MNLLILSIIFFAALFVECAAIGFGFESLQFVSKPSLMLILLVYFTANARSLSRLKYAVMLALFFSWLGDIFLLLEKQNPRLFIFGLGSFLAAHLCYIVYFHQIKTRNSVKTRLKILPSLAVLIYVLSLFILLAPNLGNLRLPVAFYTLTLAAMLLASIHAFDFRKHDFARLCVAGTSLFVLSDSLLAINRFYQPFAFAGIFIMLTYAVAQFLITVGALKNLEKLRTEN
jgi:uncharacterized membrane protein YhhN